MPCDIQTANAAAVDPVRYAEREPERERREEAREALARGRRPRARAGRATVEACDPVMAARLTVAEVERRWRAGQVVQGEEAAYAERLARRHAIALADDFAAALAARGTELEYPPRPHPRRIPGSWLQRIPLSGRHHLRADGAVRFA